MSNDFSVYSSPKGLKSFLESSISTANEVIRHYDFVINDISSEISDMDLEKSKAPTIEFLLKMRKNWCCFKTELENKLKDLERN